MKRFVSIWRISKKICFKITIIANITIIFSGVMLWEDSGHKTPKCLAGIDGKMKADRCISDILQCYIECLCLTIKCHLPTKQCNTTRCTLCSDFRVFDCCPGMQGLQIYHPFETCHHGLLRDWPTTPLQLIRLMKCVIDLKQFKMIYSFLSSKPSSTPWLTEYGPFELPRVAAVFTNFTPL